MKCPNCKTIFNNVTPKNDDDIFTCPKCSYKDKSKNFQIKIRMSALLMIDNLVDNYHSKILKDATTLAESRNMILDIDTVKETMIKIPIF